MAGHAVARLADYQSDAYARLYLERLGRIARVDSAERDWKLTQLAARRLGAWMAFEDVIRVAQLKTRPGRLARIRRELGAPEGAPLTVHEFLKPGREELMGLLPAPFAPCWGANGPSFTGADWRSSCAPPGLWAGCRCGFCRGCAAGGRGRRATGRNRG
ncbi:MAG: hypothetical protein M5U35_02915 [Roseovarius sp.]|nr:hypothetical protein [Roseovarius sp.]